MKALVLEGLEKLVLKEVPEPTLSLGGALLRVMGNGVCRSDWHGWNGDHVRKYPVVMGHEMAGVIEEVSPSVTRFKKGDRVVVPFSGSDGTCPYCQSGRTNMCDNRQVPGLTYSGGYGEYVNVPLADRNLTHLPDEVSYTDGAALGCRFITSYQGLVDRARVESGEWVVVYGCGGVGLSAINIANSLGARVIGVDLNSANLDLAKAMGADFALNSRECNPVDAVMEITKGGADVSVDALGITDTCVNGIMSLGKGGRHVQLGVTTKKEAGYISVPIDVVVVKQLQIIGSLGMPAHRYDAMMPLIAKGRLTPGKMVNKEIHLSEVEDTFEKMTSSAISGINVVTKYN